MAFADLALSMTRRAHRLAGDTGVTFYPVRAAEVVAYLAAGNSGVSLLCMVDTEPLVSQLGDMPVDNVDATLETDTTSAATITAKQSSIVSGGITYDIVRREDPGPGAVRFILRKYAS